MPGALPVPTQRRAMLAFANRFSRQRLGMTGAAILAVMLLGAVFAPWIVPQDPDLQIATEALRAPSLAHPFGTDNVGRDTLSRVI